MPEKKFCEIRSHLFLWKDVLYSLLRKAETIKKKYWVVFEILTKNMVFSGTSIHPSTPPPIPHITHPSIKVGGDAWNPVAGEQTAWAQNVQDKSQYLRTLAKLGYITFKTRHRTRKTRHRTRKTRQRTCKTRHSTFKTRLVKNVVRR